jgi:hypothetical protein
MRLALALFAALLLSSRLGLLAHELLGHGGVARLLGLDVSDWSFFVFGGGRVAVTAGGDAAANLVVQLGGIVCELIVAAAAAAACWFGRRRSLGLTMLWALLGTHALFYFASGLSDGHGDGILLYRLLGRARWWLVVPTALASLTVGFLAAGALARAAAALLPAMSLRRTAAFTLTCALAAGGLHAALTLGELELVRDARYAELMASEGERLARRQLAAEEVIRPMDQAGAARRLSVLRAQHPDPGIMVPLGIALGLVIALGAALTLRRAQPRGSPIRLTWLLLAAAASLAAVIALRG